MARSRMAEAKTNLGIIYGLQQSYKAEFETYGNIDEDMGCGNPMKCEVGSAGKQAKNELGFRVTDCNALRYLYETTGASANARSDGAHDECKIYSNCPEDDQWIMSDNRKLTHQLSVIKACHQ